MRKLQVIFALAGTLLVSAPAFAQTYRVERRNTMQRHQFTVGAGVLGYFSGEAPGTSGAWEARYSFNFHPIVAVEGGYLGAAGAANGPGATVATIVEGDIKVSPLGLARVNPYVLAGAGWGAFSGSDTRSDNSTVTIPLGLGADIQMRERLAAGARFTYRLTAADEIGPARASADSWSLTARVGGQF